MSVPNETENSMGRVTTDGRHLTYELNVIQQPERARACGSGAKSSADRRPVDPPPVVELKVYEGEGDSKTDITFQHNANFFLFTTLENARPMAKPRMPAAPSTFPVLTGSPVAGMAYLDRPSPAGYFIFPDLSVRHEGMYRLSFSLFEELKESKDADVDPPDGSPKPRDQLLSSNPMAPRAHVHFRLEVKSVPFAVYSAKKFPGLSESTLLSKTVAEQGCRVRIRRDVRMRRRDKPSDAYPADYDDEAHPHSERFGTPQYPPDRPRSISNASIDVHTPYSTGRRSSAQDYFGQPGSFTPVSYQQQPPPPPPPPPPASIQSANSYGPHLTFGGSATTPTFPPPQMPQQQQPMQNYVQNSNSFHYPSSSHSRQMSAPHNYGYHQPQQQTQAYNPTSYAQPQTYSETQDHRPTMDNRRASASAFSNHTQQAAMAQSMNSYVNNHPAIQQIQQSYHTSQQPQPASPSTTPTNSNVSPHDPPHLPPLRTDNLSKTLTVEPKYELKSPNTSVPRPIVPSPSYMSNVPNYYDAYGPIQPATVLANSISNMSNPASARSAKREFDAVFDSSHLNQPIHNGMRPSAADQGRDQITIASDDGDIAESYNNIQSFKSTSKALVYKRADGSQSIKKCPSPIEGPP
ncbi:hypothetical protein ACLMJK_002051 [Lecanora helva]